MSIWWFIRVCLFLSVTLFSIVVLGLSAYYVSQYQSFSVPGLLSISVPTWSSLSIAVSAIALITLVPMLLIDFLRKGAFTSWIVVELVVTFNLWVLYLASAAEATANYSKSLNFLAEFGLPKSCSALNTVVAEVQALERTNPAEFKKLGLENINWNAFSTVCRAHQASQAFSYIAWVFLMVYCLILLVLTIITATRSNSRVWTSTVRDTDFSAGASEGKPSLASNSSQAVMTQSYPQTTMGAAIYTPSPVPQVSIVPPQQQASQQYYSQSQTSYGAQV